MEPNFNVAGVINTLAVRYVTTAPEKRPVRLCGHRLASLVPSHSPAAKIVMARLYDAAGGIVEVSLTVWADKPHQIVALYWDCSADAMAMRVCSPATREQLNHWVRDTFTLAMNS